MDISENNKDDYLMLGSNLIVKSINTSRARHRKDCNVSALFIGQNLDHSDLRYRLVVVSPNYRIQNYFRSKLNM